MSVWVCRGCGTRYSVDAPRCPQDGVNDPIKEAEQLQRELEAMPKITVHGGPSNADTGEGMPEATEPSEKVAAEATTSEAPVVEEETVDYNAFTVDDLKAEIRGRDRNLAVTGSKAELVERLEADDAARAAEAEDAEAERDAE
jgi:hypothetical protein